MNPLIAIKIASAVLDARKALKAKKGDTSTIDNILKGAGVDPQHIGQVKQVLDKVEAAGDNIDTYKIPTGEKATFNIALPVLGDVAKGVGNLGGIYNGMLGAALLAAGNRKAGGDFAGDTPIRAHVGDFAGSALAARGVAESMLGNLIGNRIQAIGNAWRADRERERIMNNPGGMPSYTGAQYDYLTSINRSQRELGK